MTNNNDEPTEVSDQLREAVNATGKTLYAVAHESGVKEQRLRAFMSGTGLNFANFDRLAKYVGLELRLVKRRK